MTPRRFTTLSLTAAGASVVVATAAMIFAYPASASAGAPSGAHIDIIGLPHSRDAVRSDVKVRYRCYTGGDVQIAARVSGRTVTHSNRWARFGYPFRSATCDGRTHLTTVTVAAQPAATDATFSPGERVQVAVDLELYAFDPTTQAPSTRRLLDGDVEYHRLR
ncbi:hypothetical protein [Kineococcus rubinsiae]|uniref:hypothetical protein n=1 Tax=Kineococcus rubinsiae TaxID=2609562 RepID=UPI0014302B3C|nr:hypothetical protein [Kineococcus rubinsiae]NIZ90340.1 hypothetical protein [Kineococcus rubinsiae]